MKLCKLMMTVCLIFALLSGCGSKAPQSQPTTVPTQPSTIPTAPTSSPETQPTEGETVNFAPDFTVYDRKGDPVKLSDFRGKPVILNFWSSKCPPCRAEMPDFQEAYETYGEDIYFVMVNLTDGSWDTVDSAKAFADGSGYTFPIYFDTDNDAAATYYISSIPTTYFISAAGSLVAYGNGMLDADALQSGIDMIYPK